MAKKITMDYENTLASVIALRQLSSSPLYIKSALRVRRLLTEVRKEEVLINELREDILKRYADRNGDDEPIQENGTYKLSDTNKRLADHDWTQLLKETCTLSLDPVCIDDIGDDARITAAGLDVLLENGLLIETANDEKPVKKRASRKKAK